MKNTTFKKSDIKTGMLVETADGYLRIVIGGSLISCTGGGGILLNMYDENLKPKAEVDYILNVYSEPIGDFQADFNFWLKEKEFIHNHTSKIKLLYSSDDRVMSIEEIEKELGYKIKIKG
jgi:hypothetical protein